MAISNMSSVVVCFVVMGLCHSGMCLGSGLPDYLVEDTLDDGQHEVRLHWRGVTAKQTSIGSQSDAHSGLLFRQVSYKDGIVQLIYNGDPSRETDATPLVLKDCEFTNGEEEVKDFLVTFIDDVEAAKEYPEDSLAGVMGNVTFNRLNEQEDIPEHLQELVKFRQLKAQCKNHHRKIRTEVKEQKKQTKNIQDNEDNEDNELQGHSRVRRKADTWRSFFIIPGTKWCGNQDIYDEKSPYADQFYGHQYADRCCRDHDRCSVNIPGLTKKYRFYNNKFSTISHCFCDERFRACLKMARTGASNVVGQLFFDVIKTRCFVFKKEKVCKKKSWWSKCEKWGYERKAVLRDPIPWVNHPSRYA